MSIGPFHAISFLSVAPISFALQIQIPDEKHIFQGQNTTVILIHDEGDPTEVFLKKVAPENIIANDALQVINFTNDAEVNMTFHTPGCFRPIPNLDVLTKSLRNYSILAFQMDPTSNRTVAMSPVFEVQDNPHPSSEDGQKGDSSNRGLIIGAVSGSVAFTVIILLTVYLIFFRSRRRRSFQDQAIHHSLAVPTPFLKYITTKCSPRRKPVRLDDNSPEPSVSGSIAQRDSLQTFAEESTPHESTVLPLPPPAMSNESAGEIPRLRAQIQQLILERASARTPDNESDPPPAYVEEITENVLRVETLTS
ncbi:uncharacterized protein ARMOST_18407 [Armillaria ostoyae]|uniref:Mid2 domain-containing protein n=1 Tax=Armillaria ostoyae TaxID=47428 RepID=A0A284S1N9_ARMOS|nr:uncharacterized protein ARMOST_18407 [Armillaria ostoyae]